jgi:hypothetical protein
MIVLSIQSLVNYVRGNYEKTVYKTEIDPVTMKQIVVSEVYTQKGTVEKLPDKGNNIDKQV